MKEEGNMMKKRISTLLAAVLMFSALFAGCGNTTNQNSTPSGSSSSTGELQKVVVTEFRGVSWAPMYLAYQLGYYEEEGLDVQLLRIDDGPTASKACTPGIPSSASCHKRSR